MDQRIVELAERLRTTNKLMKKDGKEMTQDTPTVLPIPEALSSACPLTLRAGVMAVGAGDSGRGEEDKSSEEGKEQPQREKERMRSREEREEEPRNT